MFGHYSKYYRGWSRLRDRTLTVKSRKIALKSAFVKKLFIFLLVMPKYEGYKKNSFLNIPEVGEKQKA